MAITEPTAIDPYRTQEVEGVGIVKLVFTGLLTVGDDHRLAAGVAHSYRCSRDGRRWTFHLRSDTRFSNGEPVDAASFVRGVNRALDPGAATETAYHVAGVEGFQDVATGRADTLRGLRAVDAHTLVVELGQPDFEFAAKTLQPIFSPVPTCAGPAHNPAYNDMPIGNGPFLLAEPWQHEESLTLARNPYWWGPPVALSTVQIDISASASALDEEYAGFEAGRYHYARVPGHSVTGARAAHGAAGRFLERDLPGLHYLIPFCHRPPMDTSAARHAVSLAIDRAGIAESFFDSTRRPATSLLSPWFRDCHDPAVGAGHIGYDPAAARAHAARAGLLPGASIDLAYNTGADHGPWVRAAAAQLRDNLGWQVNLLEMTSRELVAYRTSEQASGLCRAGWAYDYPTPDNLLFPLLHSSCTAPDAAGVAHGDNEGRYASGAFDRAVERARGIADSDTRARAWQDAERIAVADLALIPLWYRTEHRVVAADRFSGVDLDFFGNPALAQASPRAAGTGTARTARD